jgi:hypothetical protein
LIVLKNGGTKVQDSDDFDTLCIVRVLLTKQSVSTIKTCLKTETEKVFEKVKSVIRDGDTLKFTTAEGVEVSLSRSKLKAEMKAAGRSEDVAESILRNCENGCFSGVILVTTIDGFKRFDQIKEGEYVLSKDVNAGIIEYKEVSTVYLNRY